MQPRHGDRRRCSHATAPAASTASRFGVQSMVPARARRARPHPRPRQRRAAPSTAVRDAGFDDVQPRPHLRRRRRDRSTTGDARSTRRSPSTRRTVSAYGLTVEPGTPLAADPPAIPTTTTRPTSTCWPTERARRRRASTGTRSRTGPGPATSAGTTSCTGRRATTSGFGCAAHSHRAGPAVVERAHARALHRRRRRTAVSPEAGHEVLDDGRAGSRASSWRCAPGRGVPATRCPRTTPPSTGSSSRRGDRARAHASRAACWPTRWRSGCADPVAGNRVSAPGRDRRQLEHLARVDEVGVVGHGEAVAVEVDELLPVAGDLGVGRVALATATPACRRRRARGGRPGRWSRTRRAGRPRLRAGASRRWPGRWRRAVPVGWPRPGARRAPRRAAAP